MLFKINCLLFDMQEEILHMREYKKTQQLTFNRP